jgi:hypothetical protein
MRRALSDDFNAALTYTHYQYLDDSRPARYNYDDLSVSMSYLDQLVATLSYQPDSTSYSELGYAAHRPSFAYELAGRWPLPRGFALTAGAGYYDLHRLFGVRYWAANAGAQFTYRRITVDLSHFFVDSTVERLYEDADANSDWVLRRPQGTYRWPLYSRGRRHEVSHWITGTLATSPRGAEPPAMSWNGNCCAE